MTIERSGTSMSGMEIPEWSSLPVQFWRHVVEVTSGCWEWTGHRDKDGYGRYQFQRQRGVSVLAHRRAWEDRNGRVPFGKVLDHVECDNPPCVRPDHLRPSTIGDNTLRGSGPSAVNSRKTKCKNGHDLTGDNVRVIMNQWGKPRRICRKCERVAGAKYDRKRLPVMSKKRRGERLTRAEVVLAARQRDGGCVGRGLIPDHHCSGALAGHEVIPRSAWPGGHLVVENVRTLCKAAHRWVHAHEREAHALGLHGYSWERP